MSKFSMNTIFFLMFLLGAVFLSVILVLLFSVPCVSASTIYVDSPSQAGIENALISAEPGDIVLLPAGTYSLSSTLNIPSGIILSGSGYDTIITCDPSDFAEKGAKIIYLNNVKNVKICNLKIDGGEPDTSTQHENGGHDWGNAIWIRNSDHVVISDVYFTRLDGDAVRGSGSDDIIVSDCSMLFTGHDGVQAWGGENWTVQNCKMNLFINSGIRYANTVNSVIKNNDIYCNTGSGFCAVELEYLVNNVLITENYIHDIYNSHGVGIATVDAAGTVYIYENQFSNCPGGIMDCSGISIISENNNFVPSNPDTDYSEYFDIDYSSPALVSTVSVKSLESMQSLSESSESSQSIDTALYVEKLSFSHIPQMISDICECLNSLGTQLPVLFDTFFKIFISFFLLLFVVRVFSVLR